MHKQYSLIAHTNVELVGVQVKCAFSSEQCIPQHFFDVPRSFLV